MKKRFLLFVSIGLCASAYGQRLTWHSVDGRDFYQVSACTPGSVASLYASPQGGHLLSSPQVGSDGSVTVEAQPGARPAMVLNSGANGTHRVAFSGKREFAFESFRAGGSGDQALLSWNGAADDAAAISFEVLRSVNGGPFRPVKAIPARSGSQLQPYSYSEALISGKVAYKIRIRSGASATRHTTEPVLLGRSPISVYPTEVTQQCYISAGTGGGSYTLIGADGRKLAEGQLAGAKTSVPMAAFAPGTYTLDVRSEAGQERFRVVKR